MPPPFGSSSTNVNININSNVHIVNNSVNINGSHAEAHGGVAGARIMGGTGGGGALAIHGCSMGYREGGAMMHDSGSTPMAMARGGMMAGGGGMHAAMAGGSAMASGGAMHMGVAHDGMMTGAGGMHTAMMHRSAMAGGGAMHMGSAHAGMVAGAASGGYGYGYHGGMHAGGAMMAAGGGYGYECRGGMRAGGAMIAAGMHGGGWHAGWYGFRQSWAQHFHWMDHGVYDSWYQWQMTLRAMPYAMEASQQRTMLTGILRRSRGSMTKANIEALVDRILHSNRLVGAGNDGRVSEIIEITTTTTTTTLTQEQRFEAANEFINTLQRDSSLNLTVDQAKQVSDSLRSGKKDDPVRTHLEQKQARGNMPQTSETTSQQLQMEAPRTPTPMPWQQRTPTPAVQSSYASVHRAEQNRQDPSMSQQQGSTTTTTTSFMTVTQAQRLEAANAFANNLQSKGGMGLNAEQGKQIAQAILSGQKDDMVKKIVEEKQTSSVSQTTHAPQQNLQIQAAPAPTPMPWQQSTPTPALQHAYAPAQQVQQGHHSNTITTTTTTTQQHHQAMMDMVGGMQALSVQSGQVQSPQPTQQVKWPPAQAQMTYAPVQTPALPPHPSTATSNSQPQHQQSTSGQQPPQPAPMQAQDLVVTPIQSRLPSTQMAHQY